MSKLLKNLHKPCDKLDKYDNEPYMKNPLLKLKLADIRKYRRQSQLEQSAVKVRETGKFSLSAS
jgi:dynein heavy chain, axonemal